MQVLRMKLLGPLNVPNLLKIRSKYVLIRSNSVPNVTSYETISFFRIQGRALAWAESQAGLGPGLGRGSGLGQGPELRPSLIWNGLERIWNGLERIGTDLERIETDWNGFGTD
jgi:hypothetical protein